MSYVGTVVLVSLLSAGAQTVQSPQTVESAKADGARYPKATDAIEQPLYRAAFGPSERECVDAETHVTARSGDFVAGPFDEYVLMAGGRKLWWMPRQADAVPPLTLSATKLGPSSVAVTRTFSSVVSNENGLFFNTEVRLPEPGRWLVVVTAGNSWGCFILSEPDLSQSHAR